MRRDQQHTVIAMLAAGLAMALTGYGAFVLRPRLPGVSDDIFGAGAAFAVVAAVSAAVFGVRHYFGYRGLGNTVSYDLARLAEQRESRAAELAADPDPRRRAYAERVGRGEAWSDAEIAYTENPQAWPITCAHLRHVEQSMRAVGIWARPYGKSTIWATCQLNEAGVRRNFVLADCVVYRDAWEDERYSQPAQLYCNSCESSIQVYGGGPWFPDAPQASAARPADS